MARPSRKVGTVTRRSGIRFLGNTPELDAEFEQMKRQVRVLELAQHYFGVSRDGFRQGFRFFYDALWMLAFYLRLRFLSCPSK